MLEMGGASLLASLTFQEPSWRRLKASCSHSGGREDVLERQLCPSFGHRTLGTMSPRNWICVDSQDGSTQNDNLSEHLTGQTEDGDEGRTTS